MDLSTYFTAKIHQENCDFNNGIPRIIANYILLKTETMLNFIYHNILLVMTILEKPKQNFCLFFKKMQW